MSDFRDKAKDMMEAAREKASDAMDYAADVARDQLDTFKKLTKQGQIIVLAVVGVGLLVILSWLFWPHALDVTIEMVPAPVVGNRVAITNNEESDLGKTTIILDDQYEATIRSLATGETTSVAAIDFHQNGNPNGATPSKDLMPKRITVKSSLGTKTRKFKR